MRAMREQFVAVGSAVAVALAVVLIAPVAVKLALIPIVGLALVVAVLLRG